MKSSARVSGTKKTAIFNEIKKMYALTGCKLAIRRMKSSEPGSEGAGEYDIQKNRAYIYVGSKTSNATFLFICFHELRHSQHAKAGLYPSYYHRRYAGVADYLDGSRKRKPEWYRGNAYRHSHLLAERDCDRFALRAMTARGIKYKTSKYKKQSVMTFLLDEAYRYLIDSGAKRKLKRGLSNRYPYAHDLRASGLRHRPPTGQAGVQQNARTSKGRQ